MLNDDALNKLENTSVTKQNESNADDREDYRKGIAIFKKLNK